MKADLFFQTPKGYDGHLEILDTDDDETISTVLKLLQRADTWLEKAGAKPRPLPGRGGGSKAPAGPPPETCPQCQKPITAKDWQKDGKKFKIYKCPADEAHFKRFMPA